MVIVNVTRGTAIARHIDIAASFRARAQGLIGRADLPADHAFVLYPCNGVHALFLAFPLNVIYLDRDDRVLLASCLRPWHVGPIVWRSRTVIELPTGTVARTETVAGDLIAWQKPGDAGARDAVSYHLPWMRRRNGPFHMKGCTVFPCTSTIRTATTSAGP